MAPTLRKGKGKVVEAAAAKPSGKKGKRKAAAEDVSPVSTKKQKRVGSSKTRTSKASTDEALSSDGDQPPASLPVDGAEVEDEVDEEERALVSAFQSSGDESDAGDNGVALFKPGQDVGQIPKSTKAAKKELKKLRKLEATPKEDSGVVYVGHIPHGFYEDEMRSYFSQFGDIKNLRLSRNKRTGHSKHYAFIEFAEESTAEVVVQTMNNYLLFGRILKCSVVPKEKVNANLWKGANRRFKTIPWTKIDAHRMERPKTESQWTALIGKEQKKRLGRAEKLKAIGYEFEATELKSATLVLQDAKEQEKLEDSAAPAMIEAPEEEAVVLQVAQTEPAPVKVLTKAKTTQGQVVQGAEAVPAVPKTKKSKKSEAVTQAAAVEVLPKAKKGKKTGKK